MEEIQIKDILNIIKDKIILILIIIMLMGIVGLIYATYIKKPMYNAQTTMVLTSAVVNKNENESTTNAITQSDILLNQKLVSTYSEIIKSRKVANQVIQNLGLNISAQELSQYITITLKEDTEMLQIKVTNKDPIIAKNIANDIAQVFSKEIVEIYNISNISVIDEAQENLVPYNMNKIKDISIFMAIGVLISGIIVFLLYLFDTTIKRSEDVETKLNLVVLATIPTYKK